VTGANYDPRREMHFIDPKTVRQEAWVNWGEYWHPKSVSSTCPHCGGFGIFALKPINKDAVTMSVDFHSDCPSCYRLVSFFAIGCARVDKNEAPKCESLWMHPKPPEKRKILIDEKLLKFEIFDAYQEAVECFNDQRWRATVTECRRALEGISENLFSEKERKLLKPIGEGKHETIIPNTLYSPILELTKAIRLGGLSGAHFNLQRPADEEIASKVLDMTEYLLKYFYELPSSVKQLKEIIEKFEIPL